MVASPSRKPDDSDSRLERFRTFTVAHPRLVDAKEALVNAIRGPNRIRSFLCLGLPGSARQHCG